MIPLLLFEKISACANSYDDNIIQKTGSRKLRVNNPLSPPSFDEIGSYKPEKVNRF
jgi:hypothetical protein